jgi:hypothetical protein
MSRICPKDYKQETSAKSTDDSGERVPKTKSK